MKISTVCLLIILVLFSCKEAEQRATKLNANITARLEIMLDYPVDSVSFPRSLHADGTVRKVPSQDWTSGFFPGSLLQAYQITGDKRYLAKAKEWLPFIEKEKINATTHDMGFKVYCSFGNAYEIESEEHYKEVILQSAETLAGRFNPKVGCLRSWDFGRDVWDFPVIIDNMMNLELLFQATILSGDSSFYAIAVSHADTTLKYHFRSDNSSYHVVDYDPETGDVRQKMTHQGSSDSSAWARGQAWGLYGFTMAHRYTGDTSYLAQAKKIASFIINHPNMPADKIPYWDFDAPDISEPPRDASAASIIASALLELHTYSDGTQYLQFAKDILQTLYTDEYLLQADNNTPFLLKHSTGNKPKDDEIDVPISYADYYFLEAVKRFNKLN